MNLRIRFAIAVGALLAAGAVGQTNDEYQVKAAFLFNFAKFVEWPPQTFKSPSDPMSICVLGPNPFGRSLDEAVAGKSIDGRRFVVRQVANAERAGGCQILFIASPQKSHLPELVTTLAGVLTVGESEGFAAGGGVIGFKLQGGRVRLEVNVDAADQRKLRISSKLLSLAQIVKTEGM
jgi:uncharacterized protein DUF4154